MIIDGIDIESTVGGLLAGTWVNSYFFMIELIMCYRYFTRYGRSDPIWLKGVVAMALAVDTTSTINHYACVWLYTITHWGEVDYVKKQYWPIPVYLVTTGASAWIVQQFLIYRFYLLSKNRWISPILLTVSYAAFGGSIATAAIITKKSDYSARNDVQVSVTIWLVSSAIADISIAVILIYTLQRMKTNFRKTKNLIRRLTTLAIQTGGPGSVVASLALALYLQDTEGNISVGVAFSLGRVYAITMLHNLNSREHVRRVGARTATGAESGMPITISETFLKGLETRNDTLRAGNGIQIDVHQTAMVHMDGQNAKSARTSSPDDEQDLKMRTFDPAKESPGVTEEHRRLDETIPMAV